MHFSSGIWGLGLPKQPWNFKGSINYIICSWWSRLAPGCTAPVLYASLCHSGPAMPLQQKEMFIPPSCKEGFPYVEGNFCLPLFGSFWLVFSEGLWGSWKPLHLKLEILETLFLFTSIWLISVYDLCNVLPCGSLEFGMWTHPVFPGRKWFLPAQCREVTLACSEQSLRNSFNREKIGTSQSKQRWCRREVRRENEDILISVVTVSLLLESPAQAKGIKHNLQSSWHCYGERETVLHRGTF